MIGTHAQANDGTTSQHQSQGLPNPAKAEFEKLSSRELKAEQARQAKRRKRNEVITAQETEAEKQAEAAVIAAAAADSEKKTTKKERKMAETKVTELQQHASTNEAARMATANLLGRFGSSKKKTYSWMAGGGGAASRAASSTATPMRSTSAAAPAKDKAVEVQKGPQVGQFDEGTEPGVQARDLLLVLESDGRAAQSFVRASSIIDETAARLAT